MCGRWHMMDDGDEDDDDASRAGEYGLEIVGRLLRWTAGSGFVHAWALSGSCLTCVVFL